MGALFRTLALCWLVCLSCHMPLIAADPSDEEGQEAPLRSGPLVAADAQHSGTSVESSGSSENEDSDDDDDEKATHDGGSEQPPRSREHRLKANFHPVRIVR